MAVSFIAILALVISVFNLLIAIGSAIYREQKTEEAAGLLIPEKKEVFIKEQVFFEEGK